MKFEKKVFAENKINIKIVKNYMNQEKKYLECIYFQILRNSQNEEFTEYNLYNFLSFSDFLHKRIFNTINKNNNKGNEMNHISIEDFKSCLSIIFSPFYIGEEENKRDELIFKLISDLNDALIFSEIRDFFNHLIFEAFCKAKITEYDLFIFAYKSLKNFIKKYFFLNVLNFRKNSIISKNDFFKILKKNPIVKNLIIFLLNLVSPLNEKLLTKVCKRDINFHLNDDFEPEWDLYDTQVETPKINDFSKYKEKEVFKNKQSNLFQEKTSSKCFEDLFKETLFYNGYLTKNQERKEEKGESTDTSPNLVSEKCPNQFNSDSYKTIDKSHLNHDSKFKVEIPKINKFEIFDNNFNEFLNEKNDKHYEANEKIDIYEGNHDNHRELKVSFDLINNNTKPNISDKIINKIFNNNYYNLEDFRKGNLFVSDIEITNLDLIRDLKNTKFYEILVNLHQKIKLGKDFPKITGKFKVLFLKETPLNNKDSNEFPNSEFKNTNYNYLKNENIIKNSFSLTIKFIRDEMIIYNIRKTEAITNNYQDSEYFYYYKLNYIIFDPLPKKELCRVKLNFSQNTKFYYLYGFSVYDHNYKILFEDYYDLLQFHKKARKLLNIYNKTFSFIYKNKKRKNFDLIQHTINFDRCYKRFSYIHEIFNEYSNSSLKIQSFNKRYLQKEQYKLILSFYFSLCRLNNFFKINIFPIAKIYENDSFFIIEYSEDEFIIEYDNLNNNYVVTIKNMEFAEFFKVEVSKFKKLVKILNLKTQVDELFQLFNIQKSFIFSRFV